MDDRIRHTDYLCVEIRFGRYSSLISGDYGDFLEQNVSLPAKAGNDLSGSLAARN